MTHFTQLSISNFKRFVGHNKIPLRGKGQVTVIAAQNGVGKTTILDAFNLALHGKRAFAERYPKQVFSEWLENAYSVDAQDDEFRSISFALELDDPFHGQVRVQRTFWLMSDFDGGFTEDLIVTIDGKPLALEEGESKTDYTNAWIEELLPRPLIRKFLVDGERLSDFDSRNMNEELIQNIDDLLEIGILRKLNYHLHAIQKETMRKMVPPDELTTLENLLNVVEEYKTIYKNLTITINEEKKAQETILKRIEELNKLLQNDTIGDDGDLSKLRIKFAIIQSELTNKRNKVMELITTSLPFIVAGIPSDLNAWKFEEARMALESNRLSNENMLFISTVLDSISPPLGIVISNRVNKAAKIIAESNVQEIINSPLSHLTLEIINSFEKRYNELQLSNAKRDIIYVFEDSKNKLMRFNKVASNLRSASQGLSIIELANELKSNGMALGATQANIHRMSGELSKRSKSIEGVQQQIENLQSRVDNNSFLNRKKHLISQLRELLSKYTIEHRATVAKPLEKAFEEGFKLLSRKSNRLESITINPTNYHTTLSMRKFEGNWLDRDLSATEKQHVGLSLLYALRKVGNRQIPVVIDTPTSRMDRGHKKWSVTRFYPQLSHQVIVLATSDDLGDGLYEELKSTDSLGLELMIEEVEENTVNVVERNLAEFFGA